MTYIIGSIILTYKIVRAKNTNHYILLYFKEVFIIKKIHITYKWQPTKESFQKDKYYTDIKKYIINCKLKQNIYL